jgi:DNA polymerase-3 subunit epsilon
MNDEIAAVVLDTPHGPLAFTPEELAGFHAVAQMFPGAKVERVAWHYRSIAKALRLKQLGQAPDEPVAELVDDEPRPPPRVTPSPDVFVCLDFETGDAKRDSACALAVVRIEGDQVVAQRHWYIRPPRQEMPNAGIHGITWGRVARAKLFEVVWAEALPMLQGAAALVAHNAAFDRSCVKASLGRLPSIPWLCTVKLAKSVWPALYDHTLPTLAKHLGLELKHHDALSDTLVCAGVFIAAKQRIGAQFNLTNHLDSRAA